MGESTIKSVLEIKLDTEVVDLLKTISADLEKLLALQNREAELKSEFGRAFVPGKSTIEKLKQETADFARDCGANQGMDDQQRAAHEYLSSIDLIVFDFNGDKYNLKFNDFTMVQAFSSWVYLRDAELQLVRRGPLSNQCPSQPEAP